MRTVIRTLALAVSLVMLLTGPLAPLANAPQPAPAQPAPPMEMKSDHDSDSAAYNVGAGVANAFYIPGKAALCGLGGIVGIFVLIVSLGSAPKTAAGFARE